jgi:hypothetical protein
MAGSILGTPGPAVTPAPSAQTLPTNYITNFDFLDQNLPDTDSAEFKTYGNRSVAGFLRMVGAEMATNSDLVKWAENGRLHTKYEGVTANVTFTQDVLEEFTIAGGATVNFRVGQTVLIQDEGSTASRKGVVTAVGADTTTGGVDNFEVAYYTAGDAASPYTGDVTVFVYGSEFRKGDGGMVGSNEAESSFYDNKTIIMKDNYEVSGSDMAQIGWVEAETEEGSTGYYWFLKSQSETRTRFEDYMEMSMIEAVPAENTSGAEVYLSDNAGGGNAGSDGLFWTIEDRGNVWDGGYPTTLSEYDSVIERMDTQGAIAENVMFLDRNFGLAMDDMLAAQNSHGAGGTSYGLFDNSEDMALNLGFDGFKRAGYEFYKTDWKYLNHYTLRGGTDVGDKKRGVLVPAGSMSVYDQMMGERTTLPFLHIKYRASEHTNRRFKTWITGGEAGTDSDDLMRVNFLTERALCTMGAQNFMLFQD